MNQEKPEQPTDKQAAPARPVPQPEPPIREHTHDPGQLPGQTDEQFAAERDHLSNW